MKNFSLLLTIFFGIAYFLICTLFYIDIYHGMNIAGLILDLIFVIGIAMLFVEHWKLYFKIKDDEQQN